MNTTLAAHIAWPDNARFEYVATKGGRCVRSLDGVWDGLLPGVTTFLRVLGLGTEGLVKWSANEERKAVIEAAGEVYQGWAENGLRPDAATFLATVEGKLGPARQHQKQLAKAADIGTAAHLAIHDWLLGKPLPALPDQSLWAVMAFQDWFRASALEVVASEQRVYDLVHGYAGVIDIIARDPEGRLGIVDIKTAKYVYDEAHLQVAAYLAAGRHFAPLEWGRIVRVPKNTSDPAFEVRELGDLYERKVSEADLLDAAHAALAAWRVLKAAP